jgi:hypothetical protein
MWLKCLVGFLLLADTVNAVFDLVYVYEALIINFGKLIFCLFIALNLTSILQVMWNI